MEVYYGHNRNGTVIIYVPYYFAGMSLNGTRFRFRFDFPFLDRLAKSRLSLEGLAEKDWKIKRVDINECYLNPVLDSFYSGLEENTVDKAHEIVDFAEGLVANNRRSSGYDDGYSGMDNEDEILQDKWWDLGLEALF